MCVTRFDEPTICFAFGQRFGLELVCKQARRGIYHSRFELHTDVITQRACYDGPFQLDPRFFDDGIVGR